MAATNASNATSASRTAGENGNATTFAAALTLRMAEAGALGGMPVPVAADVVLTMGPVIVACIRTGTLHEAPAASVTPEKAHPLPLNTAEPGPQVYEPI